MNRTIVTVLITFLSILATRTAVATDLNTVQLHGYGSWGYARTDGNDYINGDESGNWDSSYFALAIAASPIDRLEINAQVFWGEGILDPLEEEYRIELFKYAFANWRVSDGLQVLVGKVKHPFGIYTEIFDVGTLRPFFSLPNSVYGQAGNIAEAYNGIGFRGDLDLGNDWAADYDLYVGRLVWQSFNPRAFFAELDPEDDTPLAELGAEGDIRDIVGARLVVHTPIIGLSVGLSGFSGQEDDFPRHHTVYGAHLEYVTDHASLRSEYVHRFSSSSSGLKADSAYVETSYYLTDHWQGCARYEWTDVSLDGVDTSAAPSLLRHVEYGVGINYWVNPYFVFKLSYHYVDGNRYAHTLDTVLDEIAQGTLKTITNLGSFGAQFSF